MLRIFTALALAFALMLPAAAREKASAVKKLNEAVTALQGGDAATALPLLTDVIDNGGLEGENLWIAYFSRGAAYSMLKQCANAIPDFTKALELKPQDHQSYAQRGNCYNDTKQVELAIADLKQAVALDPTNEGYAGFLCAVAFNGKVHAEAGPACEAYVVKFKPNDAELIQASAQSYEAAGNKKKANEMWKRLLAVDPKSEAAKQGIARTK